ncbi:MAG TPA: T9SS type A sorting domain-containing protein [Bacteroidota bacterium]|nr:T9SS type A sorting domain-containing protein [Bacteroidota bacterium]
MRTLGFIFLLLFLFSLTSAQMQFWQQTNGPTGGSIRSFAVNKHGKVYAATSFSGIFRSTNNGTTWEHIGAPHWSFICIAVSFNGIILAGHSGGILRSTDDGLHWLEVRPIPYSGIAVAVAPLGQVFASIGGVIHRSTDDGASWERSDTGINSSIECLAVDSAGRVYAGGGFTDNGGVYRSTDNGNIWTVQSAGLNRRDIVSIAVDSSGVMYAASPVTIARSTNMGEQWEQLSFPVDTALFRSLTTRAHGELFVGTTRFGVFRSTDFGLTWAAFNQGLRKLDGFHPLASNNTTGSVYVGAEIDGVYRWFEGENAWDLMTFPGAMVFSLASDQMGRIFSSAGSTGIWRTTDRGEQWVQCRQGLGDTNIIGLLSLPSGILLAYGSTRGSIYRSTNSGDTWIPASSGLAGIYLCSSAVDSAGRIYLGTYSGIFVSTNEGETWGQLGTSPYLARTIAITPAGVLFADVPPGIVSRSTDQGVTWTSADSGLSGFAVQTLSAGRDGNLYAGGSTGVFSSTNGGLSWNRSLTVANAGLTFLVQNSLGDLFASVHDGQIFRKRSNDTSWANVSGGLPFLLIGSLAISSDGFLFVGTYGASVLRSVSPTTDVEAPNAELPVRASLFQNYPNPFNPKTTIKFQIPNLRPQTAVSLKVYDLLGREIATLVNEVKEPGAYTVQFDASGIASGVYFYQLRAGGHVETKMMLLLR